MILRFWLRSLVEEVRQRLFYSNKAFRKLDAKLRSLYRGESHYRISSLYWDDHTYGETPISTYAKIAQWSSLSRQDRWVELGSGRGRGLFWIRATYGCEVVGIEKVPTFVERARCVGEGEFVEGDLREFDYSKASVAYLCGTCLSNEVMGEVALALEEMPEGSRLITVSESILDYLPASSFFLIKKTLAPFSWGEGTVFVHKKVMRQAMRSPFQLGS